MNKNIKKIINITYILFLVWLLWGPFSQSRKMTEGVRDDITGWNESLTWIKENTPNCSVIATYWDPGHLITSIADRRVVFDGASQNDLRICTDKYPCKGVWENKRSRIQDISTTLFTSDEEKAYNILQYYKGNCSKMYYLVSDDLIGKSQWWTYFATWSPNTETGTKYIYKFYGLRNVQQSVNKTMYTYPTSDGGFILIDKNGDISVIYKQLMNIFKIKRVVFYETIGQKVALREKQNPDAKIDGTLWVSPDRSLIVFIPPQLQNSMFTRLYFFYGSGLKHFKLVKSWESIKLYEVV